MIIDGWFNWQRYYEQVVRDAPLGARVVEVGVYKGASFNYLCRLNREFGKQLDLWAVDTWWGSREHELKDYLPEFLGNMKEFRGEFDWLRMSSVAASRILGDETYSVFIDGAHDERNVHRDIMAWGPGAQRLAGHDYCTHPTVKRAVDRLLTVKVDRDQNLWIRVPGT